MGSGQNGMTVSGVGCEWPSIMQSQAFSSPLAVEEAAF